MYPKTVRELSEAADLTKKADELSLTGKFEEALQLYDQAIAVDPTDPLSWIGKASVLKALERYSECVSCFDEALKGISALENVAEMDDTRLSNFTAMLYILKAEALLYAENPVQVFAALNKAAEFCEPDAASSVVRGQAYLLMKNYEEAGNCFYQAEEWCNLNDDSMLTQVWLCKVHLAKENGGRLAPSYAAEMYARGTGFKQPAGDSEEILEKGNNLRKEGLLYDALRYYDAALSLETENKAVVLFYKGVTLEQLKKYDEAFSVYSDALKENPFPEDEFRIRMRWTACKTQKS